VTSSLHAQNVVALVWDFDKTLIPGYMQDPIFAAYGVDAKTFWNEVNALPAHFARAGVRVHPDTTYLNHLITYAHHGRFPGLNNARLRELGRAIAFHAGLPEFFDTVRTSLADLPVEIRVEHYIVSTGLRAMIEGCAIRPFVDGIWASEFIESAPLPGFGPSDAPAVGGTISQIAVAYDNTSKTRALFEINKGSNRDDAIDVNATMRAEDRRVPFEHMIYIADGPSDVPAFSLLGKNGGSTLAVYDEQSDRSFAQAERLRHEGRVEYFGPANYAPTSPTARWLILRVRQIAQRILDARDAAVRDRVGAAPKHLG